VVVVVVVGEMDATPLPPAFKTLAPILKQAALLRTQVPLMSYLCSIYALQLGLRLKGTDPANKSFLLNLMNRVEAERAQLQDKITQAGDMKAFATNFGLKVFGHADDEYRAGLATRETAKNFYAAAVFLNVLHQFDDPLPEEIEQMRKYAKYSAVQITKAIKQGVPVVHPDMEGESAMQGDFSSDPFSGSTDFDPSSSSLTGLAATQPTSSSAMPFSSSSFENGFPSTANYVSSFNHQSLGGGFGDPTHLADSRPPLPLPSFPSFSPPPSHSFPSAFDAQSRPRAPPTGQAACPAATSTFNSVESLLSLFPTVPTQASRTAASPSVGPGTSDYTSSTLSCTFSSAQRPCHTGSATSAPSSFPPKSNPSPPTAPPVPSTQSTTSITAQTAATSTSASSGSSVAGFTPTNEAVEKAQKCARFAVSALQFEDLPYAVQNLRQALFLLTGKQHD